MPLPLRAAPPPPRQRGRWTGGAEGPSVPGPRSRSPELGSVPAPAPLPAPSRLSRRRGPLGVLPRPFPARHSLPLLALPPSSRVQGCSVWLSFGVGSAGRVGAGCGWPSSPPLGPEERGRSAAQSRPPVLQEGRWAVVAPQATARSKRSSSPLLGPLSRRPTKHPELAASAVGIVSGGRSLVPTPTGRVCVPAPPLTWAAGAPSVPRFTHARREQGAGSAASRMRWLPAACWGRGACSGRLSGPRREPGASGFEGRVGQRRMY